MTPLADRIRPKDLADVVGQSHLTDFGKPLYKMIESGFIPNMIFYGPSGVGKTTVANILALRAEKTLYKLNATTAQTADIKSIVADLDTFMAPNGILLYLDEIQFFNKKQQQLLLEYIENGKITLIASTTENPYFYVYNAILSRSTVFEFKPVSAEDIKKAVLRAVDIRSEESGCKISIEDSALDAIAYGCGGDVRKSVNAIEFLTMTVKNNMVIGEEEAKAIVQRSSMRYDKDGDAHYDILSAFQKSIRGSDENAALHYLARLLSAGDMISACRRLLVIASEDIGLAYPVAASIVKSCVDSALQLGLPEARLPLAEAVLLLAKAPKSNSVITSIDAAMKDIELGNFGDIPSHLKDAHYGGAEKLGNGTGYKYPHSFENNYVKQQYLPDIIKDKKYYDYGNNKNEQASKAYWENIKK